MIEPRKRLILFRGAPGSGKSTAAAKMFPGTLRLENDMYFMHNGKHEWSSLKLPDAIDWCVNTTKNALANDMDVVVCNTFTKARFIEHYQKMAREYGAEFIVYRCNGKFRNVHGLPEYKVEGFRRSMEDWPGEIIVNY